MNFINSFDSTKYSPTYAALVSLETYPFRQALITMYLSLVYMYVFTVQLPSWARVQRISIFFHNNTPLNRKNSPKTSQSKFYLHFYRLVSKGSLRWLRHLSGLTSAHCRAFPLRQLTLSTSKYKWIEYHADYCLLVGGASATIELELKGVTRCYKFLLQARTTPPPRKKDSYPPFKIIFHLFQTAACQLPTSNQKKNTNNTISQSNFFKQYFILQSFTTLTLTTAAKLRIALDFFKISTLCLQHQSNYM